MSTLTVKKVALWQRLRFSLFVSLSVILIILAASVGLVNSEVGTKWLVGGTNKIKGLQIDNVQGTLFSKLEISSVTYTSTNMDIVINDLTFGIDLSCLWEGKVCLSAAELNSLHVIETKVQTSITEEHTDSKINLPMQISLPQIKLGKFTFDRLNKSQIQLEGLKVDPIVISATDSSHLLNLTDIDVQLESLFILLPNTANHSRGSATKNSKKSNHRIANASHAQNDKGSETSANLDGAFETNGSDETLGSPNKPPSVSLTSDLKAVIAQIQHSQSAIYTHISELFALQKNYSTTLQNISLPKLQFPVNSVNASISVSSINILKHKLPPLIENLSVKLNTQLKQIQPEKTQLLIETFTGQHDDFSWMLTGAINETYTHELAINFQWAKPELVATELVSPIEHLIWRSSGYILNPEIDISTTGLINAKVKMLSNLRKVDTPLDLKIYWAPFKYSYQDIHMELGEGFLQAHTDTNTIDVAFDIPLNTFVLAEKHTSLLKPNLRVTNISSRCSMQINLAKIKSDNCIINVAENPFKIDISGTSEQGLNIETAFQIQNTALPSDWFVNGKRVTELLAENSLAMNNGSELNISTKTFIRKDNLHIESAVTLDDLVFKGITIKDFNSAIEISADVDGMIANIAETQLALIHARAKLDHQQARIKLTPSQFSLDYKKGLIQTSAMDLALFDHPSMIDKQSKIPRPQERIQTLDNIVSHGNIRIAPITVDINAPNLSTQLIITDLNLQNILDVVQGIAPSPILANLQTNSSMMITLHTHLSQRKKLEANITANLLPSTWEYDSLNIDLSPAQLKGELAWDTTQPISTLTGNMQTEVSGSQLGKIALEIERTDKTKLYAELFSVNLGVFAPFMPQFKNFGGLASANLALAQTESNINIDGVVIIPELNINIEKLPKSAQTPHPDIQFKKPLEHVFDPKIEESEGLNISSNINVFIDPLQQNTVTISALDFASALNGYVNVSGKVQSPLVMGDINLVDGSYAAYGQDLLIRSGSLNFTGPVSLPYIDIEAIRNPKNMADATIAGLQITGNPNQLKASLFSEPMLENPNILSYLIRGKGLDASSDEDNSVILTNALLGYGLGRSADAVSKIGDAFGVDDLQLGTQGQGEQTQIGVSGKLNDRLSIEYRVGVFSAITEFGLRYQWLPNLYLEATSGASNALDVFYEIKWGERQLPEEQATNKPSTNNPKK